MHGANPLYSLCDICLTGLGFVFLSIMMMEWESASKIPPYVVNTFSLIPSSNLKAIVVSLKYVCLSV